MNQAPSCVVNRNRASLQASTCSLLPPPFGCMSDGLASVKHLAKTNESWQPEHSVRKPTCSRPRRKLLDTSHPAFRAVSAVKSRVVSYWRDQTLPYVEPGVRLVRLNAVPEMESHLRAAQIELDQSVSELDRCWGELVDQARHRLGDLFDVTDYSPSIADEFEITWDLPRDDATGLFAYCSS